VVPHRTRTARRHLENRSARRLFARLFHAGNAPKKPWRTVDGRVEAVGLVVIARRQVHIERAPGGVAERVVLEARLVISSSSRRPTYVDDQGRMRPTYVQGARLGDAPGCCRARGGPGWWESASGGGLTSERGSRVVLASGSPPPPDCAGGRSWLSGSRMVAAASRAVRQPRSAGRTRFEWPFFAGYGIYMWWRVVHEQPTKLA